jgi:sulfotransferase
MKFPHRQHAAIRKPEAHAIPERIQAQIESACAWYYQLYYPARS